MFLKLHERDDKMSYLLEVENRHMLNQEDSRILYAYQMGYAGELELYNQLMTINGGLKIWDITLNKYDTAQYDFLIIGKGMIHHIDVKNYTGEYTYIDGMFKREKGKVDQQLITQMKRANFMLAALLFDHKCNYKFDSHILFINDSFKLKTKERLDNVMFVKDIQPMLDYVDQLGSPTEEDYTMAQLLLDNHLPLRPRIHYYDFNSLRKGYKCPLCKRIAQVDVVKSRKTVNCKCGKQMLKMDYILACAEQLWMLKRHPFKISEIVNWSGCDVKTVQRVLVKKCMYKGENKGRVYWF